MIAPPIVCRSYIGRHEELLFLGSPLPRDYAPVFRLCSMIVLPSVSAIAAM
jgi:hypothetical protein